MKIKKYLYVALMAVVCGAMFVACGGQNDPQNDDPTEKDDTIEKCWEVTRTYTGQGGGNETMYVWATEFVVSAQVDAYNKTAGWSASYKEADANDLESCSALNAK
jgi:hypothetical protein